MTLKQWIILCYCCVCVVLAGYLFYLRAERQARQATVITPPLPALRSSLPSTLTTALAAAVAPVTMAVAAPVAATGTHESYCLWPGDTLSVIAEHAGVTVDAIMAVNPNYTGYAGSTIQLPPGSIPPAQWSMPLPPAASITDLPFGVSGYYISHDNRTKRVALSFDIGFVPENQGLIEGLSAQGIHATFFVLGDPVSRHPELISQVLDNGHELGNHSFTHANLLNRSVDDIGAELRMTERVVNEAYAGATTKPLFRAPFGAINVFVNQVAAAEGYHVIGWTIDSSDWTENVTADKIYNRVVNNICPGAIIALHDVNPASAVALPQIITFLRANGYEFATVSELLFPQ